MQVLYEIVFANGNMTCKFGVFSTHPRTKVSMDMSLEEVAGVSSVLSVECTQEPMDALTFNTEVLLLLHSSLA